MIHSKEYIIPDYLCDYRDKLSMWGVARLCQTVAGEHIDKVGLGFSTLIAQGKAWVLCRVCYEVERLPQEGERVMLKTWSRGTDGLFAFREHLMQDEAGNRLAAATSYWAIIDFDSRHVTRLHDIMYGMESHPELATSQSQLNRLRIPKDVQAQDPARQLAVQTSMIDHTKHVNNAEYIKWIIDAIGQPLAAVTEPFSLTLEYQHETHPGDTASVLLIPAPDATYFQISNSREVAVLAKLRMNSNQ